jgi:hypothetical protein
MHAVVIVWACLIVALVWDSNAAAQPAHEVELADQVLRLPADDWRQVEFPEPFAVRFEARAKRSSETFPQLLTIFKLPMQFNDRIGVTLTADELADFLFLYPVKVTYRMRVDRGTFWVESLQTFEVPMGMPLRVAWQLHKTASPEQISVLLDMYDTDIKRTRFQLRQLF